MLASYRSVLGHLLFNIYLNDYFFLKDGAMCTFVDDTTTYICDKNLEKVLNQLSKTLCLLYVSLKTIA